MKVPSIFLYLYLYIYAIYLYIQSAYGDKLSLYIKINGF